MSQFSVCTDHSSHICATVISVRSPRPRSARPGPCSGARSRSYCGEQAVLLEPGGDLRAAACWTYSPARGHALDLDIMTDEAGGGGTHRDRDAGRRRGAAARGLERVVAGPGAAAALGPTGVAARLKLLGDGRGASGDGRAQQRRRGPPEMSGRWTSAQQQRPGRTQVGPRRHRSPSLPHTRAQGSTIRTTAYSLTQADTPPRKRARTGQRSERSPKPRHLPDTFILRCASPKSNKFNLSLPPNFQTWPKVTEFLPL